MVEACLAHRETDRVKAAYNRAKFNDERKALKSVWTRFLAGTAVSSVLPLRAAAA